MLPLGEQWQPRGGSMSRHPMRAVREGKRDAAMRARVREAARSWQPFVQYLGMACCAARGHIHHTFTAHYTHTYTAHNNAGLTHTARCGAHRLGVVVVPCP